jgi:DNA polymerase-3 subunit gamma/tau
MYRVLARKYRPQTFADLIGQEVLVRTLTNAFASGRIAHAFLLTGIRGIGKTTTARIIARGLNCIGADGKGEATTDPCGVCANCIAIRDDRHVDVIEMDAASRTGVDDIREIIDSVHYAPTSARYKVYIIDEVHMLSKNAFNALLKTLEEPPPHVKFIFATTEIRKIPMTIISRCQRFDLRRVDGETLTHHLVEVAKRESVMLDPLSAELITVAAEGSVRDALSILDQAMAMHTDAAGATRITPESLREMLGIADQSRSFALIEQVMTGKVEDALTLAETLYQQGIDPALLLGDLMEITHYLTRILAAPTLAGDVHYSPKEQETAIRLAAELSVPALTRAWQILLKGSEEMRVTSQSLACLEMILVRLGYASQLPPPAALIRQLQEGGGQSPVISHQSEGQKNKVSATAIPLSVRSEETRASHPAHQAPRATHHASPVSTLAVQPEILPVPESLEEVVALFDARREAMLTHHLTHDLRLVRFAPGRIEMHPITHLAPDIPARINRYLSEWTGLHWNLIFSDEEGEPTLAEQKKLAREKARTYATQHPKVQAVLAAFPGAKVLDFIPN